MNALSEQRKAEAIAAAQSPPEREELARLRAQATEAVRILFAKGDKIRQERDQLRAEVKRLSGVRGLELRALEAEATVADLQARVSGLEGLIADAKQTNHDLLAVIKRAVGSRLFSIDHEVNRMPGTEQTDLRNALV